MKRCSALAAERGRQVHRPVHRRRMSRRAYLIPKRRSRPARSMLRPAAQAPLHRENTAAKETDGSYLVTLDCVEKMYGMSLKVTFSVTYTDDWVYGRPTAVYFSGDSYTDSTSMTAAMMLLYGQLDEQGMSELMAYDMLWDVLG